MSELTATEAAVLGLLLRGGEQSGYDLSKNAGHSVGYFWSPVQSRMYATLPRLVERGLAVGRELVESNRLKQLYRITPDGKRALRDWLHEPPVLEPERNTFLLKIFLGGEAGANDETLAEHVRERRLLAERLRDELRAIDARAREETPHAALTRNYGLRWAEMVIEWADETERTLRKTAPAAARRTRGA